MLEPLVHKLNNMRVILATTSKQRIEVLAKTVIDVCTKYPEILKFKFILAVKIRSSWFKFRRKPRYNQI